MEVLEALKLKKKLEQNLLQLVHEFEEDTDLIVRTVNPLYVEDRMNNTSTLIKFEVKTEL